MDAIFDLALDKFNITKSKVLEDWINVLRSPGGLAGEFGKLQSLYDALNGLPELNSLASEKNNKDQKRLETWRKYAKYSLDIPIDAPLPDSFQVQY